MNKEQIDKIMEFNKERLLKMQLTNQIKQEFLASRDAVEESDEASSIGNDTESESSSEGWASDAEETVAVSNVKKADHDIYNKRYIENRDLIRAILSNGNIQRDEQAVAVNNSDSLMARLYTMKEEDNMNTGVAEKEEKFSMADLYK